MEIRAPDEELIHHGFVFDLGEYGDFNHDGVAIYEDGVFEIPGQWRTPEGKWVNATLVVKMNELPEAPTWYDLVDGAWEDWYVETEA